MYLPSAAGFAPKGHRWIPCLVPAGLTPPQQQHLAPGMVPMLGWQDALRLNTEIHLASMEKNGEKGCGQKAAGETAKLALKYGIETLIYPCSRGHKCPGGRMSHLCGTAYRCHVIKPPISFHSTFGSSHFAPAALGLQIHHGGQAQSGGAAVVSAGWVCQCCQTLCWTPDHALSLQGLWREAGGVCIS